MNLPPQQSTQPGMCPEMRLKWSAHTANITQFIHFIRSHHHQWLVHSSLQDRQGSSDESPLSAGYTWAASHFQGHSKLPYPKTKQQHTDRTCFPGRELEQGLSLPACQVFQLRYTIRYHQHLRKITTSWWNPCPHGPPAHMHIGNN